MTMSIWARLTKQVVHPLTGIVNDLTELQVNPGDPDLHFYAAQLPDLEQWLGFSYLERSSAAGRTRQEAIAATLGEAIERYAGAASMQETGDLLWAPWNRLGSAAVDPRRFALYAPEQYASGWPFSPPTVDQPMRWATGYSLTQRREVLVPAQFAYLPYQGAPGEPILVMHTSTGTACGETYEQAVLSGLCEVIERDAFMIHWLCRLSAPMVDITSDLDLVAEVKQRYERAGIRYYLFDFTTDIAVPSYFCAVVEEGSNDTALAVGAATRTTGTAAARKALMESIQTRVWLRQMAKSEGLRRFSSFSEVNTFEDHVNLWGNQTMLPHADFLLKSDRTNPLRNECEVAETQGRIDWVVNQLAGRGMEAIVVDVTPSDIRSLGLHVVKAIVPEAIPLSADHRFEPLGGARLYEVPALLGYAAPKTLDDFNPVPHPFP